MTIENDNTVEVSEVNVTVTISITDVCPFTENINIVFNTKPVTEPTTSTSTDDIISKTTFILKWFKTYDVIMTACTNPSKTWSNETCKNNTLVHDTNNFMCGDINNTLISREKLCNDPLFPDCPNDLDESSKTCQRKISFDIWIPLMTFLFVLGISAYLIISCTGRDHGSKLMNETETDNFSSMNREEFKVKYKLWHISLLKSEKAKQIEYYFNYCSDYSTKANIGRWIAEEEYRIHKTPEEMYACVKGNFSNLSIVKQIGSIENWSCITDCKIWLHDFLTPWKKLIAWTLIFKSFLILVFSLYDFMKDAEIAVAIRHYDNNILQNSYEQISGLNLGFFFWMILAYMIISQVITAIYWWLRTDKPIVLQIKNNDKLFIKGLKLIVPYFPGVLSIIIFCDKATKVREIWNPKNLTTSNAEEHEKVLESMEEMKKLDNLRTDIKSIEVVTESSVQLIFQVIILFRLRSILAKEDLFSFPVNFEHFVIITMAISAISMVLHVHKYQRKDRKYFRPMLSIGSFLQLISWLSLVGTKVFLYSTCFVNYPALICVPKLINFTVHFLVLRFTPVSPTFRTSLLHTQLVETLMRSLLPISKHQDDTKFSSILSQTVPFILYFFESSMVLLFAFVMKTSYHFQPYGNFLDNFSSSRLVSISRLVSTAQDSAFFSVLLFLFILLVSTIIFSGFLQFLNQRYFHPKMTYFADVVEEIEKEECARARAELESRM